jgi:negative regulator of sigma E activity
MPKKKEKKDDGQHAQHGHMNELCHVWPLEHLLCLQERAKEVKEIRHRYHLWKDCLRRDNEHIAKWNARRKVCEREIQSKKVAIE